MSIVEQFSAELSSLCDSLEKPSCESEDPRYVDLCNQLWSLVYRPCSESEKEQLVTALNTDLRSLAARSRSIAQRIESTLELRWGRTLLERDVPLSVGFHLFNRDDASARRAAFTALLHGYPMAWALPRYSAELELLRTVASKPLAG